MDPTKFLTFYYAAHSGSHVQLDQLKFLPHDIFLQPSTLTGNPSQLFSIVLHRGLASSVCR